VSLGGSPLEVAAAAGRLEWAIFNRGDQRQGHLVRSGIGLHDRDMRVSQVVREFLPRACGQWHERHTRPQQGPKRIQSEAVQVGAEDGDDGDALFQRVQKVRRRDASTVDLELGVLLVLRAETTSYRLELRSPSGRVKARRQAWTHSRAWPS
jgi:hypothetical protein